MLVSFRKINYTRDYTSAKTIHVDIFLRNDIRVVNYCQRNGIQVQLIGEKLAQENLKRRPSTMT
jgi:hypothetical protein